MTLSTVQHAHVPLDFLPGFCSQPWSVEGTGSGRRGPTTVVGRRAKIGEQENTPELDIDHETRKRRPQVRFLTVILTFSLVAPFIHEQF